MPQTSTTIIRQFLRRDASSSVQFIKYGMTGMAQLLVDALIFAALGWKIFPALRADEWAVKFFNLATPALSEPRRALNFAVCKSIAFVVATYFGYVLSVKWVFEPGRHPPGRELSLFFAVSLGTFLAGAWLSVWTISAHGFSALSAFMLGTFFSVACNYLIRKFYIFKN